MLALATFLIMCSSKYRLHAETDVILDVPTLHVLFTRPQKLDVLPTPGIHTTATEALQKELVSWIAEEALGGDQDAAEWVLLASIARVFVLLISSITGCSRLDAMPFGW